MAFSDIIGHKDVIKALEAVVQTAKVGHAYLFTGPAGVGKKTLTRAFAAKLLCNNRLGGLTCDCPACRSFRVGGHSEFITVTPDGNSIKIEQLRELQRSAYLKPLVGEKKVFYFPDVEQLTEVAANSFLKLLEEPPPATVFLFTAVRIDRILPTIRSRCQIYNLFPVAAAEINAWLVRQGVAPNEAMERSSKAQGLPGLALEATGMTTSTESIALSELWDQDLLQLLMTANTLEKRDRREVLMVLQDWEAQARNSILGAYQDQPNCRPGPGRESLIFILEQLAQTIAMIECNVNLRLALDEFFLALKLQGRFT